MLLLVILNCLWMFFELAKNSAASKVLGVFFGGRVFKVRDVNVFAIESVSLMRITYSSQWIIYWILFYGNEFAVRFYSPVR